MLRACLRIRSLLAAPRSHGGVTDWRAVLLQGPHVSCHQIHPLGTVPGLGGHGSGCSLQRDALGQPSR